MSTPFASTSHIFKKMALIPLLMLPFSASADSKFSLSDFDLYVGASLGAISVDAIDSFEQDVNFKSGEVMGGASWRWIGVEARYGTSLMDETINLGRDPDTGISSFAETGIDSYQSIYLRIQFENSIARIYGLYGETEVETSAFVDDIDNPQTVLNTGSGDAYGLGAGIRINDHLFFNIELKSLINTEDTTFNQATMGVEFRFW